MSRNAAASQNLFIPVFSFGHEMPVVCSVDGIEADYELVPQFGGTKKCVISLSNQKKKLHSEKASAGEGYAQYFYMYKQGPGRTNQWKTRMTLVGERPVSWTSADLDSGGESVQMTLEESLFACSGFVRGNLEGTIKAPALHLKIMGKDIWAFFFTANQKVTTAFIVRRNRSWWLKVLQPRSLKLML